MNKLGYLIDLCLVLHFTFYIEETEWNSLQPRYPDRGIYGNGGRGL